MGQYVGPSAGKHSTASGKEITHQFENNVTSYIRSFDFKMSPFVTYQPENPKGRDHMGDLA
jgi:hypothetical protein